MAIDLTEIERIFKLISEKDVSTLKAETFDIFRYQGFNPEKIVSTILKVKEEKRMSDAELSDDIFLMIAIGVIKGNVTDNNKSKMSEKGQTSLSALQSKYGIKYGGGKNQPAETITFPRVVATFPDVAIKMIPILGAKEFPGGPFVSERLPSFMKLNVFPSIIPKTLEIKAREFILKACLCYSVDQTVALSTTKKDTKALLALQQQFVMLSYNSPVAVHAARISTFKSLNISNSYSSILNVLSEYIKIDSSYKPPTSAEFSAAVAAVE